MAEKKPVPGTVKIACLQVNSGREISPNLARLVDLAEQAIGQGARFIATPEVSDMLEPVGTAGLKKARTEAEHPALPLFSALARKGGGVWILLGSLVIRRTEAEQKPGQAPLANRSFLINDQGEIVARYDKIHMFDVEVGDGQSYRESRQYQPGEKAVLAQTPWGKLGMTICYDLRFPALHRCLAQNGASILTVPAAFTRVTGKAHWHSLLRARAIETGCFVIAPAQCGTHAEGRQTFGHSLIIDPWGEILADGGTEPGIVTADLNPARVDEIRTRIPSLTSDRSFALPQ